jgi:hypothetical protein
MKKAAIALCQNTKATVCMKLITAAINAKQGCGEP